MRPVLIAAAVVVALFAATPAGACAADDDPCLNDPQVAKVTGEVWWEFTVNGSRDADEQTRTGGAAVWADYNGDGVRQRGEPVVETDPTGRYSLPVDTRQLDGRDRVDVRRAVPSDPRTAEFTPRCVAPAAGCLRNVEVHAGQTTSGVGFPTVGTATLHGTIWDDKDDDGRRDEGEGGVRGVSVFIDDDGDGVRDPGERASARSVDTGGYGIPIPPRYQEAGGLLPPVVLERAAGVDCSAPRDCTVRGLKMRSGEITNVDHGVARPVVIFLHGYGGSQIVCPGKLMWFNPNNGLGPDLMDMRLGEDGENLRADDGGSACSQNASVDGLVMAVAGKDIYGGASEHFDKIAWPGRHYDYVWDWRKAPEKAVPDLDAMIDRVRAEHGVSRVQLVGHSMGGLVMRHYIETPAYADKVQRMVTVGSPYWGAPKTIFPLAAGTEVPYASGMDVLLSNTGMKASSRTFGGHFSLMPAFGYGGWLSVDGLNGGRQLDMDGLREYLTRIGVNPDMYTRGAAAHGRVLDHYEDHGVDYQVIVGGGVPTIGSVALSYGINDSATISWANGDGTVPQFSAAHDTPRDRLHVVCGVEHVPITADPQTTRLMDEFLIRGEQMRDEQAECEWRGQELSVYYPKTLTAMTSQAATPRVTSGGRSLTLRDAELAGLVQVVTFGASTKIVAMGGSDVRVELPAGGTAAVRDLSNKGAGPERRYAVTGPTSFALGGSGAVTRAGKPVKPSTVDRKAPVTRAALKRLAGGKVRLTLKARDASKVAATYVVVAGKRRAYTKPLTLPARRLARMTYGSVDIWGNAEAPRRT